MGELNNYIDILETHNLRVLNRQALEDLYKSYSGNTKEFLCHVAEQSNKNVVFLKDNNCCESSILYFLTLEGFTSHQVKRILTTSRKGENLWLVSQN